MHPLRTRAEAAQRSVQQDPPPEWVSEIQRLRTEVARFKASANRPVRDSFEAVQIVRAAAEQNLPRQWLIDDMNLEMRTMNLEVVVDPETISLLGPLIAKGADHMRAICRQEISDEEFRSRSAPGEGRFAHQLREECAHPDAPPGMGSVAHVSGKLLAQPAMHETWSLPRLSTQATVVDSS